MIARVNADTVRVAVATHRGERHIAAKDGEIRIAVTGRNGLEAWKAFVAEWERHQPTALLRSA